MKSEKLLQFVNDRLVNVYHEHPNTDYLIALRQLSDDLNLKIKFLENQNIELGSENQFLNDEYHAMCELLPKDARYLDMPDGGSVHPSEQMRRMIVDLNEQIEKLMPMHIDNVRHIWESRNCGSCTELAEHHDAFAIRLEDAENQYSELHDKNSKLAAQVELLQSAINKNCVSPDGEFVPDWVAELDLTKTTALKQIEAKAGRAGVIFGIYKTGQGYNAEHGLTEKDIETIADEYAENVKVGKND